MNYAVTIDMPGGLEWFLTRRQAMRFARAKAARMRVCTTLVFRVRWFGGVKLIAELPPGREP